MNREEILKKSQSGNSNSEEWERHLWLRRTGVFSLCYACYVGPDRGFGPRSAGHCGSIRCGLDDH